MTFKTDAIKTKYEFIRKDVIINFESLELKNNFFREFKEYFISIALSKKAQEIIKNYFDSGEIKESERHYLKKTLKRIFDNTDDHYKGTVGEILFSYYFIQKKDFIWHKPPKGRSSAEPGIDYITFEGNKEEKSEINFCVWEVKTTENSFSSRSSQIVNFFKENGSFEENIDSEIAEIQSKFENEESSNLKEIVDDLFEIYFNKGDQFHIGGGTISTQSIQSPKTMTGFESVIPELKKEQRRVKLFFFQLLNELKEYLKEEIWRKL